MVRNAPGAVPRYSFFCVEEKNRSYSTCTEPNIGCVVSDRRVNRKTIFTRLPCKEIVEDANRSTTLAHRFLYIRGRDHLFFQDRSTSAISVVTTIPAETRSILMMRCGHPEGRTSWFWALRGTEQQGKRQRQGVPKFEEKGNQPPHHSAKVALLTCMVWSESVRDEFLRIGGLLCF